jgi:hypothetical protein
MEDRPICILGCKTAIIKEPSASLMIKSGSLTLADGLSSARKILARTSARNLSIRSAHKTGPGWWMKPSFLGKILLRIHDGKNARDEMSLGERCRYGPSMTANKFIKFTKFTGRKIHSQSQEICGLESVRPTSRPLAGNSIPATSRSLYQRAR